jgi:hypothetical protein
LRVHFLSASTLCLKTTKNLPWTAARTLPGSGNFSRTYWHFHAERHERRKSPRDADSLPETVSRNADSRVIETFSDESKLAEVGVFTKRDDAIRDFMIEFLSPMLKKVSYRRRRESRRNSAASGQISRYDRLEPPQPF